LSNSFADKLADHKIMPTSGTHITIVQRIAVSDPQLKALLGDPFADETTPEGRKARFANLGAVGPDVFYAMMDYGGDLQDLENFLIKVAGTFECIAELMGQVDRYVAGIESVITFGISDELKKTFTLLSATINEGLMALVIDAGVNLWPVFEPARQKDEPRTKWFWADYLHYVRTGKFVRALLRRSKGNDNLTAYALGYLTHYVTDVVGHPYVNQVVEAPWRLYWQRHHLVENFIDAYVWDRWHVPLPPPPPPSTEEQPLDHVTATPNVTGMGAPFTFARLNDHINIGTTQGFDPVDDLVEAVCDKIHTGLFDIGVAETIESPMPADADFDHWAAMMRDALREVYDAAEPHPENLAPSRPNGYPTKEDIAAAYGVFRLVMRIATEEKIQEPQAPNITGDISAAVQQLFNDIASDLGSVPPFPVPSTDGSFSWDSLWDAIKNIADWFGQAAEAVGKAIFDFIKDSINLVGTTLSEPIKFALFLLNKFLFSIYRQFRDVLMLAAYSVPFTDQLSINIGGPFNTSALWRSMGDPTFGLYPSEEIDAERQFVLSTYAPFRPPRTITKNVERPPIGLAAPYKPKNIDLGSVRFVLPTLPDDFIDAPLGPDDMFQENGPEPVLDGGPNTPPRNFGGAIANSIRGIQLAMSNFPRGSMLPDYNLDGDRGYAWPTWDPDPAPTASPPGGPFAPNPNAGDPLNPTNPANAPGEAHVNAIRITG
jgi:hypothetical protein